MYFFKFTPKRKHSHMENEKIREPRIRSDHRYSCPHCGAGDVCLRYSKRLGYEVICHPNIHHEVRCFRINRFDKAHNYNPEQFYKDLYEA